MTAVIQRESVEKLEVTVITDIDPELLTNDWAFAAASGRPEDWTAGTWRGDPTGSGPYTVTAVSPLLGVDDLDLEPGYYVAWVRVNGEVEQPVVRAGQVMVQ